MPFDDPMDCSLSGLGSAAASSSGSPSGSGTASGSGSGSGSAAASSSSSPSGSGTVSDPGSPPGSELNGDDIFDPNSSSDNDNSQAHDPGCLQDHWQQEAQDDSDAPGDAATNEDPPIHDLEQEQLNHFDRYEADDVEWTNQFNELIRHASLDNAHNNLDEESCDRLCNPPEHILILEDPDVRLSIKIYMDMQNASEKTYKAVWEDILERYPDSAMLSFDQVKRRVEELSGIVPILHDMCINSCIAYTPGPWANHQECHFCHEPRYDPLKSTANKNVPRQQFYTFPIGPQLQALWRTVDGAKCMRYRERRTAEILAELEGNDGNIAFYNNVFCGSDYLDQVIEGQIKSGNMVLMLSVDRAQLYKKKASDTWIYIWVVLDQSPDLRYKKKRVLPGGIIPGPNPPKYLDSFLFVALHHLAAIQNEGLQIWDAESNKTFVSHPFFLLGCADFVGLAQLRKKTTVLLLRKRPISTWSDLSNFN